MVKIYKNLLKNAESCRRDWCRHLTQSGKNIQGQPKKNGDPIARRIADDREDRGKFPPEKNGDHFFEKSRPITSQRAFQKTMAITLEVKFEPFLACTILVHAGQILFSI